MEGMSMQVIGDGYVNLRVAPDKNAARVEKLYPGDTVTVKKTFDSGWAFVQHGSKQGYMMSEYLGGEADTPDSAPEIPDAPADADQLIQWVYEALEANTKQREALEKLQAALTGAVG